MDKVHKKCNICNANTKFYRISRLFYQLMIILNEIFKYIFKFLLTLFIYLSFGSYNLIYRIPLIRAFHIIISQLIFSNSLNILPLKNENKL